MHLFCHLWLPSLQDGLGGSVYLDATTEKLPKLGPKVRTNKSQNKPRKSVEKTFSQELFGEYVQISTLSSYEKLWLDISKLIRKTIRFGRRGTPMWCKEPLSSPDFFGKKPPELRFIETWRVAPNHCYLPMTDPWDWNICIHLFDFYGECRYTIHGSYRLQDFRSLASANPPWYASWLLQVTSAPKGDSFPQWKNAETPVHEGAATF